jgi:uncharacterized protein YutE (UPF0331/DUF86 family)
VIDEALLAQKIAAARDAVERIRRVLPADPEAFAGDRDTREIVTLNLFVAVQECISLATHWLSDEGWDVPAGYRDVFVALSDHSVIESALASRMASAAGLRNLVAHRYGVLEWSRIRAAASGDLDDLLDFCAALAAHRRPT